MKSVLELLNFFPAAQIIINLYSFESAMFSSIQFAWINYSTYVFSFAKQNRNTHQYVHKNENGVADSIFCPSVIKMSETNSKLAS